MAVLEYYAQDINEILANAITNCRWLRGQLSFESTGGSFIVKINDATTTAAGLMSASSYKTLTSLTKMVNSLPAAAVSSMTICGDSNATLDFYSSTGAKLYSAEIPAATETSAGLMSAKDKQKIESIDVKKVGIWINDTNGEDAGKMVIRDTGVKATDSVRFYRYKRATLGKIQSLSKGKSTGRIHINGLVMLDFPCKLTAGSGGIVVSPKDYDTFIEYTKAHPSIKGKTRCGVNLQKKCAIVIYRDNEPITGLIKFRVKYDEKQMRYVIGRW